MINSNDTKTCPPPNPGGFPDTFDSRELHFPSNYRRNVLNRCNCFPNFLKTQLSCLKV